MNAERPRLRVVSASWPGRAEPQRARFLRDLHLQLGDRFDTEVLVPRVDRSDPATEEGPPSIHRFSYPSGNRSPRSGGIGPIASLLWLTSACWRARRLWPRDEGKKGCVLAHWAVPSGEVGVRVARQLSWPLVVWAHGSDVNLYSRSFAGRILLTRAVSGADRVIAASSQLADRISSISSFDRERIEILPVGIDPIFHRRQEPPPAPPLRVLFVGELLRSKGLDRLLEAMAIAVEGGLDGRLTVVGSGPLKMPDPVPPWLRLGGVLTPAEVAEEMGRSHLLILPSLAEGSPLVIQEAIASSLPVVATRVGGIPELFEGRSGWWPIEAGSHQQVVEALVAALSDLGGKGFTALGEVRASMRAQPSPPFDRQRCADRIGELIEELIG